MMIPKADLRYIKSRTHGGVSLKKRRKVKRPLIPGAITHVVFKSNKARGKLCFLRNQRLVHAVLKERSRKFYVEILDWVNMGNHLHLKVRFKDRKAFQNFLRTFAALLSRKLTGARKGHKLATKFWDGLVFTRVLASKLEELGLRGYFSANRLETGKGYATRTAYLKNFNQFIYRLRTVRAAPS